MERTRKPQIHKNDRLSILPDVLLMMILEMLDMKTAVQASIISTTWRSMWKFMSVLTLDTRAFIDSETREVLPSFIGFVNKVLQLRDTSDIKVFSLYWLNKSDDIATYFTEWILHAISRNVQVLNLKIRNNISLNLEIPHHIFLSQSLTELTFDFTCELDSEILLQYSIWLPCLKSLFLRSFTIYGVEWVNKLLSSCPVLNSLEIMDMWVREDPGINIECHQLQHLEIINSTNCTSFMASLFKLSTPSLTSFICEDYMLQEYSVENFSSLITANIYMMEEGESDSDEFESESEHYPVRMVNFLVGLQNVKQLTLSPADFLQVVSEVPSLMELKSPQFTNLRYLELDIYFTSRCVQTLIWLLNSAPYLEKLFLISKEFNEEEEEDEVSSLAEEDEMSLLAEEDEVISLAECTLSHLKVMVIAGFQGSDTEIQFLELALSRAIVLGKLDIYFGDEYTTDTDDGLELMMKLGDEYTTDTDVGLELMMKLRALPRVSSSLTMGFYC